MEITIYLIAGVLAGSVLAFVFNKFKNQKNEALHLLEKNELENSFQAKIVELEKNNLLVTDRLEIYSEEKEKSNQEILKFREENLHLNQRLEAAKVEFRNLAEKLQTQKSEYEDLQKKFTTEFENIANKILKKNSQEFTAVNQKNMGDVLNPLKEKLQLFEKKVEDTYQKGLKDQVDLKAELKKLSELNVKISEEANNLTKALKGDVKKQGNWGEIVLERILERSGLVEGQNFERESAQKTDDGRNVRPDVIVNLPDEKHIIIDSKVSLVAYERAVNSEKINEKEKYIKEHLISLKNHIKGLSEKHYQTLKNINSPDFVLLFIPIESSFSVAVQEDQDLFSMAWDKKVVIVSPSTLLATLRTIASIWQQENQTKNAIEISRQGGALYDKFVRFIEDMEKIGTSLNATKKNYELAMNKLSVGKGNLVRSTEKLRELGAKATKELPAKLIGE